ncbi:MAG TPA: hypothetical protein VEQ10_04520 [Vicinamibacteria bacterium]|nr:hypothetical protein [Vicinamibacteria bacterium]
MSFWLDKGIDGFPVDVLRHLIKDAGFRDNPQNPDHRPGDSPYASLLPSTRPTRRRSTRSSARCASCSTATASGC